MTDAAALDRIGIPRRRRGARALVVVIAIAVVIAIVLAIVGYVRSRGDGAPRFETARVERGDLVATVTATGTLRATNTVQIGAEVSGRVARVLVEPNATVVEGQILVELDPVQLEAQVREARANVSAAQAAVRVARTSAAEAARTQTRAEASFERGLVAETQVEQASATRERAGAEVSSASARLEVARATLERMEANLERAVIRSPISGVVLTRQVEPGQAIAAQFQTPVLFDVAEDLSRMQLTVDVDEADVGQVEREQRATFTVDAYPDRTFEATIARLDLAPRTVQGVVTYQAVLDVDNAARLLRPGMTATATIITRHHASVLLVPDPALRFAPAATPRGPRIEAPPGPAVWTLSAGAPTPHPVRVIASDGTRTVIEGEGISEGVEVLTATAETSP